MLKLLKLYTMYCIECHMVFNVIIVTFVMTFSTNKFTSIVMGDCNVYKIYIHS
jgi:hypothetical protein